MTTDALDELLGDFLLEADERTARVEELVLGIGAVSPAERGEAVQDIRRQLHTLKGNAGLMGFTDLQDLAHRLEDEAAGLDGETPRAESLLRGLDVFRRMLDDLRAGVGDEEEPGEQQVEASVRVPLGRLDRLTDLAAELVSSRNRVERDLGRLAEALDGAAGGRFHRLEEAQRAQGRLLDALQHEIRALRMVPFVGLFGRLRRLVHDEAERQSKSVRLEAFGGDTPLDRSLVEVAGEALGHLVRNAVVHGIESPAERRRRGKPETGIVSLRASLASGSVWIEVVDDGAGIDRRRVERAARAAGHRVSERDDLPSLIFLPGLTTRGEADLAAGRGQGLAVVREAIRGAGGGVEVASLDGVGSRFALRLPLSISTTEALLVVTDGERYALPAPAILETVSRASLGAAAGAPGLAEWREEPLPLVDLGRRLGTSPEERQRAQVVVMEAEGRVCGLEVDGLGDLQELVVQKLHGLDPPPPGVAGASILGDGRVVLLLDPTALTTAEAPPREPA